MQIPECFYISSCKIYRITLDYILLGYFSLDFLTWVGFDDLNLPRLVKR